MLREEMDSLQQQIKSAEESVLHTIEVDKENPESMDPEPPQKIQRFREYLEKLREALQQLRSIAR